MATVGIRHPVAIGQAAGKTIPGDTYPEKGSASWIAGNFLTFTSGQVNKSADAATKICGLACGPSSGTTNNSSLMVPAIKNQQFEINVYHTTPGSAITAKTMVGSAYGLKHVTVAGQSIACLDMENTTQKCFVIRALSKKDTEGDTYGRVIVEVADTYRDLGD